MFLASICAGSYDGVSDSYVVPLIVCEIPGQRLIQMVDNTVQLCDACKRLSKTIWKLDTGIQSLENYSWSRPLRIRLGTFGSMRARTQCPNCQTLVQVHLRDTEIWKIPAKDEEILFEKNHPGSLQIRKYSLHSMGPSNWLPDQCERMVDAHLI